VQVICEVTVRKIFQILLAVLLGWCAINPAYADTSMTFYTETDPQKIFTNKLLSGGVVDVYASGRIVDGTTDKFLAFVRANKIEAAEVHFNSPGGSLAEGMKLGRAIRTLQFFTSIGVYQSEYDSEANQKSICASACAYAFAGGTSRFLNEYTGRLGVHQFYSATGTRSSAAAVQQVSGIVVAFLDEMGIDAKAFTISTFADRDGMIWLTPDAALKLRFANNGSRAPVAEIRLAGMDPYLRVEQEHYNVTARVIFYCDNKQIEMTYGIVINEDTSAMIGGNQKRSYLELDDREFLITPSSSGARAVGDVVWIERSLTRANLLQVIRATKLGGWIDGFGAVRYGATLEMPTVRSKILEFAQQCYTP
jgi:hypothetical protein